MSAAKITKKKDIHCVIFKPPVPLKISVKMEIAPYVIYSKTISYRTSSFQRHFLIKSQN